VSTNSLTGGVSARISGARLGERGRTVNGWACSESCSPVRRSRTRPARTGTRSAGGSARSTWTAAWSRCTGWSPGRPTRVREVPSRTSPPTRRRPAARAPWRPPLSRGRFAPTVEPASIGRCARPRRSRSAAAARTHLQVLAPMEEPACRAPGMGASPPRGVERTFRGHGRHSNVGVTARRPDRTPARPGSNRCCTANRPAARGRNVRCSATGSPAPAPDSAAGRRAEPRTTRERAALPLIHPARQRATRSTRLEGSSA
jgi:hypothetical protein